MEFIKYNANPKGRKTGDCVIRAICTALQMSWEETYIEMLRVALETGEAISCKENYTEFLARRGYKIQKMPRRSDNTKYTVREFVDELAKPNKIYILNLANHVTVIENNKLYDIWDCSRKSVGNYWVID